jgi:hypothetical protein
VELKGFYSPRSIIEIHHHYHTSFSSEVIYMRVKLPKKSLLDRGTELLGESLLGNRVKLPRDLLFILYLQRYAIGQLSPIREESPFLVNTSTKPLRV